MLMESFRFLHVLTLLLFINLLQPITVVSSLGNETDHLALLKFKESIVADPHGFLNSWNDSVHFCKWGGITCGRRHQRVTALKLLHLELHGTISPYIGNLSFLRTFSLLNNSFSGKIPQQVDHLFRLRDLTLSYNTLEGEIPVNLTFCRELRIINSASNRLTGKIPSEIGSLMKLVFLIVLTSNKFEGSIPPSIGLNMPNLQKLYLSDNEFSGQIPASISNASQLQELDLGENNFVGQVPASLGKELLSEAESINFLSKVSYQTLHQVTGGFSPSNQIGSGGFGSVYKGILDQEENIVVAIKVLNLQQKGASKSFMAECNALRNIRHRNLVKIITCCSSTDYSGNDFKALVFEYMSNASLEGWLYRENQPRSGLNLLQRLNIVVDVASALWYLHDHCEPQIIHRDLKPSNVLLDGDMVARVGDFGLARLIPPSTDSSENQTSTVGIKGTIGYAAPEYAVGVEPSTQGDVYSYGILVLQLFTGRRPTDEMFVDGCNIHTFVKTCIQGRLMESVDPTLIATLEEETTISTTNNEVTRIHAFSYDIETGGDNIDNQNSSRMNNYAGKCILPILKIGLACSEESPRNRMSMEEVHRDLHRIKDAYNGISIRRERPRRS
uniref:LRR receptor-like serine/threonine-protein kinase EFR n=1 Tax=Fragaria vesca subsp. vesca TaxID=101020 RepID=UPI0005CAB326|nr:PREDICTED: LRR receptor-like serine/threonine-protein kinase EFR [Fragaria vesca subsp. vesca]